MLQWVRLDRRVGLVYLGLGLAGCRSAPPNLVPQQAGSVGPEQVSGWVAATTPTRGALHRFKWLYVDDQASKGGRGSARIATALRRPRRRYCRPSRMVV